MSILHEHNFLKVIYLFIINVNAYNLHINVKKMFYSSKKCASML